MDDLRFPIGTFDFDQNVSNEEIPKFIESIENAPSQLCLEVANLSPERLDTPCYEGVWTIRQVVHHLADSHVNCYVRFRWTLTEDQPTIRPFEQDEWANLEDAKNGPIGPSINLFNAINQRWIPLMESLPIEEYQRNFLHPESNREFTLSLFVAFVAWHAKHHTAQITALRKKLSW